MKRSQSQVWHQNLHSTQKLKVWEYLTEPYHLSRGHVPPLLQEQGHTVIRGWSLVLTEFVFFCKRGGEGLETIGDSFAVFCSHPTTDKYVKFSTLRSGKPLRSNRSFVVYLASPTTTILLRDNSELVSLNSSGGQGSQMRWNPLETSAKSSIVRGSLKFLTDLSVVRWLSLSMFKISHSLLLLSILFTFTLYTTLPSRSSEWWT